jgi:hypothetical protein
VTSITDHVTAHGGAAGSRYLFLNSSLVAPTAGEHARPARPGGTELGWPWGSEAHVLYVGCWVDAHIAP